MVNLTVSCGSSDLEIRFFYIVLLQCLAELGRPSDLSQAVFVPGFMNASNSIDCSRTALKPKANQLHGLKWDFTEWDQTPCELLELAIEKKHHQHVSTNRLTETVRKVLEPLSKLQTNTPPHPTPTFEKFILSTNIGDQYKGKSQL